MPDGELILRIGRDGRSTLVGESGFERYAECAYRAFLDPRHRWEGTGFRCVRDIVEGGD